MAPRSRISCTQSQYSWSSACWKDCVASFGAGVMLPPPGYFGDCGANLGKGLAKAAVRIKVHVISGVLNRAYSIQQLRGSCDKPRICVIDVCAPIRVVFPALEWLNPIWPVARAVHDVHAVFRKVTQADYRPSHPPPGKIHNNQVVLRAPADEIHAFVPLIKFPTPRPRCVLAHAALLANVSIIFSTRFRASMCARLPSSLSAAALAPSRSPAWAAAITLASSW